MPFSIEVDESRGTPVIVLDAGEVRLEPEEAVAMILKNVRRFAEVSSKAGPGQIKDAVLTTRAFATAHERMALIEAAKLAGLNVIALVSTPSAFAVTYGMERATNETSRQAIVDVGASAFEAAFVSTVKTVNPRTNRTTATISVHSIAWDASLGGRDFVARLVSLMLNRAGKEARRIFESDKRLHYRALAEAEKTMEVLSVNKDAAFKISTPERDYEGRVTREEFEEACADLLAKIAPPLAAALARANWTAEQVDYVQIVGGATRIPAVQKALLAAFKKQELHRHLSSDEGAAFGAAYLGAHLSSAHRSAHDFVLKDITPFSVSANALGYDSALFKAGARIGSKKTLSVHTAEPEFDVTLSYAEPSMQPFQGPCSQISKYTISGVPGRDRFPNATSDRPKVQLHFALTHTGLVELTGAEAEVTVVSLVEVKPKPSNETNATSNTSAPANEAQDAEEKEDEGEKEETDGTTEEKKGDGDEKKEEEEEEKPKFKEVRNVHRIALKFVRSSLCIRDRTEREISASLAKLEEFEKIDRAHKELAEARNGLEEYVFRTRELLGNEQSRKELEVYAKEGVLEKLDQDLSVTMNWLEEESEGATTEELRSRLATLRAPGDAAYRRQFEAKHRARAAAMLLFTANYTRSAIVNTTATREISEEEVARLVKQCDEAEAWVAEKMDQQSKMPANEDPVFWVSEVEDKVEEFAKTLKWLSVRPKKKPPPPSKVVVNETATTTENATVPNSTEQVPQDENGEQEIPQEPRPPRDEL